MRRTGCGRWRYASSLCGSALIATSSINLVSVSDLFGATPEEAIVLVGEAPAARAECQLLERRGIDLAAFGGGVLSAFGVPE